MKPFYTFALVAGAALAFLQPTSSNAQIVAQNYGSLGVPGDGVHTAGVQLDVPGAVIAGGDTAAFYSGGERTTVPFNTALNPAANAPFTIELWVYPIAWDDDDTPLSNRQAAGNRSGWTFFQRAEAAGWNFRMYNGNGSGLGWDLTGGTSTLGEWSHIVATWNGSAAALYVNGVLADNTNDPGATGVYNPNTAATSPVLSIAANFDGGSASTARVDEVAFYGTALTPAQIADHYNLASSPTAGAYRNQVLSDGAIEYLPVPEPGSAGLLALAGLIGMVRRGRSGTR
jgi:hypothetical protein